MSTSEWVIGLRYFMLPWPSESGTRLLSAITLVGFQPGVPSLF